jgi:hypothetical protein
MIGEKSWKDIERELDEDFTSFTSVLKWTVGALLLNNHRIVWRHRINAFLRRHYEV